MKSRIKNWLKRFNRRTRMWMTGRYGPDKLSLHICALSCIFMLAGTFALRLTFAVIAIVLMIIAVARICSKNLQRRAAELNAYERLLSRLRGWASLQKRKWHDRKTHRYFKCKCGKILRVPKGRGKIEITCPECHNKIIKKT